MPSLKDLDRPSTIAITSPGGSYDDRVIQSSVRTLQSDNQEIAEYINYQLLLNAILINKYRDMQKQIDSLKARIGEQ